MADNENEVLDFNEEWLLYNAIIVNRKLGARERLEKLNQSLYKAASHIAWDLSLSAMGGQRLCGKTDKSGHCPYPFEESAEIFDRYCTKKQNKDERV